MVPLKINQLGGSINGGTQKWMVYKGNPNLKWMMTRGTLILGNHQLNLQDGPMALNLILQRAQSNIIIECLSRFIPRKTVPNFGMGFIASGRTR